MTGHALLQASPEVLLLALFLDAHILSLREALVIERLREVRGGGPPRGMDRSKPIRCHLGATKKQGGKSKSVRAFQATRCAGATPRDRRPGERTHVDA